MKKYKKDLIIGLTFGIEFLVLTVLFILMWNCVCWFNDLVLIVLVVTPLLIGGIVYIKSYKKELNNLDKNYLNNKIDDVENYQDN